MNKNEIEIAIEDLRKIFANALNGHSLEINFSWNVSEKTISEIGGRLIEDYVLSIVPQFLKDYDIELSGLIDACTVPSSQRAMEDLSIVWRSGDVRGNLILLIDVKGHNETKKGSRPNLASIRKCLELYSDSKRKNEELIIFFCRYIPKVVTNGNLTKINYQILDESFSDKGIFLLRQLSDNNLDPADIGSGGQILFARENDIILVERSREEFVDYLNSLTNYLDEMKEQKKNRKNP